MSESVPLHVVAPSGEGRERIAGALPGLEPVLHDSVEELRGAAGDERCAVVVDVSGGVDCRELLDVCAEAADEGREWMVLLAAEGEGGGLTLRPLSAGFALEPDALAPVVSSEGEDADPLFELHEVLRFVARIRHDINNPLTAGLAETQLLLMDLGGEGEVGESLETIQRQLQRIQALVQDLGRLRRPDREVA